MAYRGIVDVRDRFAEEYARLNARVYAGRLPTFPGVVLTNATRTLGACRVRRDGVLEPFRMSRHVTNPDVIADTIRHEIAHAAAILLDGHRGHGVVWKRHAVLCGARPERVNHQDPGIAKPPVAWVVCSGCAKETAYHRMSPVLRAPERFRCRACSGSLTVRPNPASGRTIPPPRAPVAVVACRPCGWTRPYYRRSAVVTRTSRYRCSTCGTGLVRVDTTS